MIKRPKDTHYAGVQKSHGNKKAETAERINGAPVYTAIYKVNHSDETLVVLQRKS